MNRATLPGALVLLFLAAQPLHAEVMYQCVDEYGHKSFSNIKSTGKGDRCTAMNFPDTAPPAAPAAKPAAPAAKTPTPGNFPRVDTSTQRSRDNDRRRILETELASEQRNLEQARRELAEQEGIILPSERMQYKGGGGIAGGKVEERLQPYRDKAALHERNIEAIQREIAKLR